MDFEPPRPLKTNTKIHINYLYRSPKSFGAKQPRESIGTLPLCSIAFLHYGAQLLDSFIDFLVGLCDFLPGIVDFFSAKPHFLIELLLFLILAPM